jgi:hypothetical protein
LVPERAERDVIDEFLADRWPYSTAMLVALVEGRW